MQDIKATVVWVLVMATTLLMFLLAQNGFTQQVLVLMMLIAAWLKGQLIIDHFMGLRRVAVLWRLVVSFWLILVLGIIFSVYTWAS